MKASKRVDAEASLLKLYNLGELPLPRISLMNTSFGGSLCSLSYAGQIYFVSFIIGMWQLNWTGWM